MSRRYLSYIICIIEQPFSQLEEDVDKVVLQQKEDLLHCDHCPPR